jgi:hypothetical protein
MGSLLQTAIVLLGRRLLLAGCLLWIALPAAAAGEPIDARYFGIHLHRADTATAWPFARFGSWRLWDAGVDWAKLEPARGQWRFEKLDRLMALAEAHGVEPMLTLGVTPTWAAARPDEPFVYGAGGASEPRDLADWENYVRTVANRYKGRLHYFEIWNEPKYGDIEPTKGAFFSGTAKNLVDMACAARRVAREVDPDMRIVGPGFTGAGDRLERFLKAGGGQCIEVVGFHFYTATPEKMRERILDVRQIMQHQGVGHLPLWNTEQGYEVVGPRARIPGNLGFEVADEATEAAYIARSLVLGADAGLSRFYFYSWERLLDKAGPPKKGAHAIATSIRWLRGTRITDCHESGKFWMCGLERADRKAWLVWSTNGVLAWRVPTVWQAKAFEQLDGPAGMLAGPRIEIGAAPVLIKQEALAWLP